MNNTLIRPLARTLPLAAALALALSTSVVGAAEAASKVTTEAQKIGYSIGYKFGANLVREAPTLDADAIQQGLADALKKKTPALTEAQQQEVMAAFQKTMMAQHQARAETAATRNSEAAKKFLADNGKKKGVTTLPSGLQYQVLASGKGATPKKSDRVKVHYQGTLLNGDVFDSSVQRGEPAEFQVDQVIPGWTEALQKMKVGDKWKLAIPPELAYGKRSVGTKIEPNAALLFEVELLEVMPAGK